MDEKEEFRILIERMRAGCREAAGTLYERYGPIIRRLVHRKLDPKLRPRFDSQDFSQSVWASFLEMPKNEVDFSDSKALIAYLVSAAQHKVIDAWRRRVLSQKDNVYRERSADNSAAFEARQIEDPTPRPSQLFVAEDEYERLMALAQPKQRKILAQLRLGTTHAEIAEEFGVNEKTVRRFVERLIENLRERERQR